MGLIDMQLRTGRAEFVLDMKKKSVKNVLKGEKNAAPAKAKSEPKGKTVDKEPPAAPVLPKAKAKDHKEERLFIVPQPEAQAQAE